jgi:hypothetical protein
MIALDQADSFNPPMEGSDPMRKFIGIVAAGLLTLGSANASPLLVDPTAVGSSVSANITSSNCLGCFIDVSLSGNLEGAMKELDIGHSYTFDFFDIVVGGLIGSAQVELKAILALASPQVSAVGNGFGGFASIFYVLNGGHLTWIQPDLILLADGSYLGVAFENLFEFGIGNTTTVSATISRYAAVPEPGTAALLLVGLLTLWFASRRRPLVHVAAFNASAA